MLKKVRTLIENDPELLELLEQKARAIRAGLSPDKGCWDYRVGQWATKEGVHFGIHEVFNGFPPTQDAEAAEGIDLSELTNDLIMMLLASILLERNPTLYEPQVIKS